MNWTDNAENLHRILEQLPQFILVVSRERTTRYINKVEPGHDRDDVIGATSEEFIAPASRDAFRAALDAVFAGEKPADFDVQAPLSDGSLAWYRSTLSPIREKGEVVGALIVATNVTELKQAQEHLENLRRLLPVCAWCDRIQSDEGDWETIETRLERDTGSRVTHGLCPDCFERQMRPMDDDGSNGNVA